MCTNKSITFETEETLQQANSQIIKLLYHKSLKKQVLDTKNLKMRKNQVGGKGKELKET